MISHSEEEKPKKPKYDSKGRSPYYSLLFSDFYLREVIETVLKNKGITKKSLARRLNIDYHALVRYLRAYLNKNVGRLSDKDILRVAEYLGLEVSIDIKFSNFPKSKIIQWKS